MQGQSRRARKNCFWNPLTWWVLVTVLVLWSLQERPCWAASAVESEESDATMRDLDMNFAGDRLSVDINEVSLVRVLRRVARETGIKIVVYGKVDAKLSLAFDDLPIEEALRRILKGYDLVLLYREVASARGEKSRIELTEVQLHLSRQTVPSLEFRGRRKRRAKAGIDLKKRRSRLTAATNDVDEEQIDRLRRRALAESDPAIREEAVDEVALLEDEKVAADILERVLREDPEANVRETALANLEDLETVPIEPILDAVLYDTAEEVRLGAIEIIEDREWKDDRTIDTLQRATEDSQQEIRLSALELLGDLGQRAALEDAMRRTQHEEVRELASELLDGLGK